jgi:hypothetical protein
MEWRGKVLREARAGKLVFDRAGYLCNLVVGKSVLDVGIVEHTREACESFNWLHRHLCGSASRWSLESLQAVGIPDRKLKLIPLGFERPQEEAPHRRNMVVSQFEITSRLTDKFIDIADIVRLIDERKTAQKAAQGEHAKQHG